MDVPSRPCRWLMLYSLIFGSCAQACICWGHKVTHQNSRSSGSRHEDQAICYTQCLLCVCLAGTNHVWICESSGASDQPFKLHMVGLAALLLQANEHRDDWLWVISLKLDGYCILISFSAWPELVTHTDQYTCQLTLKVKSPVNRWSERKHTDCYVIL